jgi:hypothetical protein
MRRRGGGGGVKIARVVHLQVRNCLRLRYAFRAVFAPNYSDIRHPVGGLPATCPRQSHPAASYKHFLHQLRMSLSPYRRGLLVPVLVSAALLLVAALHSPHRLALLQWIPMNYVSPYAAVPADGGSVIHAFTQKLLPAEESAELEAPDLGYGYHRLQKRAVFYRKRLAALNAELQNRVYYAYRKHLLQRGFLRPAATSVAYLQSQVDALNAHVTQLAQELDEKDELSAHMAGLQSQALAKVMSRVHHLASLVHASALHRIRMPSPAPPSRHAAVKASNDLKWMHQLSRALSVIQAQSIHQAKMMRHVASLSREVEELRQRLLRKRQRYRARIGHDHLRGRRHVELRSSSVRSNAGNLDETPAAGTSPSARKQKLNSLLDQVEAVKMHNPASPTLDGLYHEIHSLQSLLATLPSGPQKL